ncbi:MULTISPECIES: DUF29 domain-containing protein [unclassified Endozoicomonas]|uniref:DUF29 domain-containing protein n=1 Tax=unclassified Endozoicomonas TaxID=2644528 RepID=UPI002148D516|nr:MULTISPECIES: DUF29 domain-containing protein [unclassified Endozoicomonas]
MENLYDTDFYTWSYQQAELIRQGRFNELDMDNLIEEVEDMGKARYRALESCLEQLLSHALKWQMQSGKDDLHDMDQWFRSWSISIGKQRIAILKELKKNPGLHNKLDEIFLDAYDYSRKLAANEMQCKPDVFPPQCPWTYEQIMTEDWLPEADND